MKRIMCAVLITAMMASLVACGGVIKEVVEDVNDNFVENVEETSNIIYFGQEEDDEPSMNKGVTIEETVLVDDGGVKITAKSLETDEYDNVELKLLIENNSGRDLHFYCKNVSVNGYMNRAWMSVEVLNGKKVNDSISFDGYDFEFCEITDIADVELAFEVNNVSDYEPYFITTPIQLKTSIADTYEYNYDDNGFLAYDDNGIKIVVKEFLGSEHTYGPAALVYIENNTDKNLTVACEEMAINDFMVSGSLYDDVAAGKKAIFDLGFSETDLKENAITTVESFEISFDIDDADSWDDIVDTDLVKIEF